MLNNFFCTTSDYAESLGLSLDFQNFEKEIADFPGAYSHTNRGAFYVVTDGSQKVVGCIGLRPFKGFADTTMQGYQLDPPQTTRVCEMKRLYVMPDYRRYKIGNVLVDKVLTEAKANGYTSMVLDTLPRLVGATNLYERKGFKEMQGCIDDADYGRLYLEVAL
jgi:putative acetyltransferase